MECSDTLRLPIGSEGRQQLPLSPSQPQLIPKSQLQAHVKASAPRMLQPDPGALAAQSPKKAASKHPASRSRSRNEGSSGRALRERKAVPRRGENQGSKV